MSDRAGQLSKLTRKQRDVLALVADNRTSKEIAGRLGISESAVNQRIEMVRSRLGGLPRGELARLYRQEFGEETVSEAENPPTWQKIHLHELGAGMDGARADSIVAYGSRGSHKNRPDDGVGSQLAALWFSEDQAWLWRDGRLMAFVRLALVGALMAASVAIAIAVTQSLGPVGGG